VKGNSLQPYVWMLIGSAAFSFMVILAKLAGDGAPWPIVALVRSLVPLILVALWAKADGVRLVAIGSPVLWTRSIFGSFSLVGTFYALTHMPPSEVQTLGSIFPIWITLLSWPLLGEMPSPIVWVSVLSAVTGVALVQQPGVDGFNPAALVVVAVSIFTALAMMGLNRLKRLDPRAVVVHFSGVSTILCVASLFLMPLVGAAEPFELGQISALEPQTILALLGVGVTATIGQFFLTKAFTAGAPARVSVVGLTQVVFVFALDMGLLGRSLHPMQFLGVVLIMVPTAWMMLHGPRRKPAVLSRQAKSLEPTVACK
jgi:drug/metabolite transporter (DMT)-like permease